jgi:dTDP-glucose 4,6-dehydratase
MTILVTGGTGFIGCNFVLDSLARAYEQPINLDIVNYICTPKNLLSLQDDVSQQVVMGEIGDAVLVSCLLAAHRT